MATSRTSFIALTLQLLLFTSVCSSHPAFDRWHPDLEETYDYVIVGGGQSGLVVANRLSEDPSKTVLVIEYGYLDNGTDVLEPFRGGGAYLPRNLYNLSSIPQPGMFNRTVGIFAGAMVGGGSGVNGMLFDRGSAFDYDSWEKLGNPGWGFSGLLPYFKKSTTFDIPQAQMAQEYNITYNISSAYGTTGPIHASIPPWQWPGQKIQWQSWLEVNATVSPEGADGSAYGIFWVPTAQDDRTRTRSYSRTGYYDPIAATRSNLRLLTGHRVNDIILSNTSSSSGSNEQPRALGVMFQARGTNGSAAVVMAVRARKEVVLSAGWLHNPQIMMRSGIGRRSLLEKAGVKVRVELPGVGANLQDHATIKLQHNYETDLFPNPTTTMSTNDTFAAWAQKEWAEHRRGPLAQGVGNSAAFLPLNNFHSNPSSLVAKVQAQNASAYLPKDYPASSLAGFLAQRDIVMDAYTSSKAAMLEFPFKGESTKALVIQKQLARGTIELNPTDIYAEPIVDYNLLTNPVDIEILTSMARHLRKWYAAPSMKQLTPVEITPGPKVNTDEEWANWIRASFGGSTAHSCCTMAMMPMKIGGVVSSDLKVYGVEGLSVADGSIMPMVPATHLCATTYALAEKAADIIKSHG